MNIIDRILQVILIVGFMAGLILCILSKKEFNYWIYLGLIAGILAGVFYQKVSDGIKWILKKFVLKFKGNGWEVTETNDDSVKECQ